MLMAIFHPFILGRFQTLYYYDLSINLTLQLIFSFWVLRWKFYYALVSSVATGGHRNDNERIDLYHYLILRL